MRLLLYPSFTLAPQYRAMCWDKKVQLPPNNSYMIIIQVEVHYQKVIHWVLGIPIDTSNSFLYLLGYTTSIQYPVLRYQYTILVPMIGSWIHILQLPHLHLPSLQTTTLPYFLPLHLDGQYTFSNLQGSSMWHTIQELYPPMLLSIVYFSRIPIPLQMGIVQSVRFYDVSCRYLLAVFN